MKPIEATFDEASDGFTLVPPGTYPAHLIKTNITTFKDSGRSVYNLTFRVAKEVQKQKVAKLVSDGNGSFAPAKDDSGKDIEIDGGFIAGREFRLQSDNKHGMWLTPNPSPKESWRNRNYVKYAKALGVEFDKSDDGKISLGQLEESDINGLPCLVRLSEFKWENRDNGESGKSVKVAELFPWTKGKKLPPSELEDDLPF